MDALALAYEVRTRLLDRLDVRTAELDPLIGRLTDQQLSHAEFSSKATRAHPQKLET